MSLFLLLSVTYYLITPDTAWVRPEPLNDLQERNETILTAGGRWDCSSMMKRLSKSLGMLPSIFAHLN